jgi:uncharacterized protein
VTQMARSHYPTWTTPLSLRFVQRHPVLSYYVLTFAISWGGILVVAGGPGGIPGTPEQVERLMPFGNSLLLVGPAVAGLLMTGLVAGRAGFRDLLARLLRWRVGLRWYAVALLTAPVVFTAVHLALSRVSPVFFPTILTTDDKTALLLVGLVVGLVGGGLFEELGWTGFAIPRLRQGHGVLATGLIVGVLWGAWHFLVYLWGGEIWAGELPVVLFVTMNGFLLLVGQLPAYRVLMGWVYDRTGSLLVAMLMHASLTACTFTIGSISAVTGVALLTYGLVMAAVWWLVVAAVAMANGGLGARPSLERRPSQ